MSIQDDIEDAATFRREDHSIRAVYDIEIPRDIIEVVKEDYGHKDAEIRCAKAAARTRFKNDHDVSFNGPDLIAERKQAAIEPDGVLFKVVAIR